MSFLVSHLDTGPSNASHRGVAGLGDDPAPSVPAVPAPMPTPQQVLIKSALMVGAVALLAYCALNALHKKG